MFGPDATANLDSWLLAEYETRNKSLGDQLRALQNSFSARGLGGSGQMIGAMVDLTAQELTIRARITFQRFLATAEDFGIPLDDAFQPYGQAEIDRRFRLILVPELRNKVMGFISGRPPGALQLDDILLRIDLAADREKRKCLADLTALIARKKSKPLSNQTGGDNIFNVAGNVGVIQIGSGNSATAHQQIESATVTNISQAMVELLAEIEPLAASSISVPKREIVEVVKASHAELQKAHPNWTLLRSLLSGVAVSIQTVAALQPAYEKLKGLLALVGINLP